MSAKRSSRGPLHIRDSSLQLSLDRQVRPKAGFQGWVKEVPPLGPGEGQVLGQTMTAEVYAMYTKERDQYILKHRQNTKFVDLLVAEKESPWNRDPALKALRKVMEKHVESYVLSNLTHTPTYAKGSKEWMAEVLNSLPADCPTKEQVKPLIIPDTDKRVGLRGHFGLKTVRPPLKQEERQRSADRMAVKKGDVLGVYRGLLMTKEQYRTYKFMPPKNYTDSPPAWKCSCDGFCVDINPFASSYVPNPDSVKPSPCCKEEMMVYNLSCSAFLYGNELCLMNDALDNPLESLHHSSQEANCEVREFKIGPWVFPFGVALEDIWDEKEVFYSYGDGYWDLLKDNEMAKEPWAAQQQELTKLRGEVARLNGVLASSQAAGRLKASSAAPWSGALVGRSKRSAPGHEDVPVRRYRGVRTTRTGTHEVILKGKNGADFRVGVYNDAKYAAQVYDSAFIVVHGYMHSRLNFPDKLLQEDPGLNLEGLLEDTRLTSDALQLAPAMLPEVPSTATEAAPQLLALPPVEAAHAGGTLLMQDGCKPERQESVLVKRRSDSSSADDLDRQILLEAVELHTPRKSAKFSRLATPGLAGKQASDSPEVPASGLAGELEGRETEEAGQIVVYVEGDGAERPRPSRLSLELTLDDASTDDESCEDAGGDFGTLRENRTEARMEVCTGAVGPSRAITEHLLLVCKGRDVYLFAIKDSNRIWLCRAEVQKKLCPGNGPRFIRRCDLLGCDGEQRRMKDTEVNAVRAAKVLPCPNIRNTLITVHLAYSVLKFLGVSLDVLRALEKNRLAASEISKATFATARESSEAGQDELAPDAAVIAHVGVPTPSAAPLASSPADPSMTGAEPGISSQWPHSSTVQSDQGDGTLPTMIDGGLKPQREIAVAASLPQVGGSAEAAHPGTVAAAFTAPSKGPAQGLSEQAERLQVQPHSSIAKPQAKLVVVRVSSQSPAPRKKKLPLRRSTGGRPPMWPPMASPQHAQAAAGALPPQSEPDELPKTQAVSTALPLCGRSPGAQKAPAAEAALPLLSQPASLPGNQPAVAPCSKPVTQGTQPALIQPHAIPPQQQAASSGTAVPQGELAAVPMSENPLMQMLKGVADAKSRGSSPGVKVKGTRGSRIRRAGIQPLPVPREIDLFSEAEEDAAEPSAAIVQSQPPAELSTRDPRGRFVSKPVAAVASAPRVPARIPPAVALPVAQAAAMPCEQHQGNSQAEASARAAPTEAGLPVAQTFAREQHQGDGQGRADAGKDASAAGVPIAQAAAGASIDKQCQEHDVREGATRAVSLGPASLASGMLSPAEALTHRTPTGRTKKQARKLTNSLERGGKHFSGCERIKLMEPALSATPPSSKAPAASGKAFSQRLNEVSSNTGDGQGGLLEASADSQEGPATSPSIPGFIPSPAKLPHAKAVLPELPSACSVKQAGAGLSLQAKDTTRVSTLDSSQEPSGQLAPSGRGLGDRPATARSDGCRAEQRPLSPQSAGSCQRKPASSAGRDADAPSSREKVPAREPARAAQPAKRARSRSPDHYRAPPRPNSLATASCKKPATSPGTPQREQLSSAHPHDIGSPAKSQPASPAGVTSLSPRHPLTQAQGSPSGARDSLSGAHGPLRSLSGSGSLRRVEREHGSPRDETGRASADAAGIPNPRKAFRIVLAEYREAHPEMSKGALMRRGTELWNSYVKGKKDTYQKLAEEEQARWIMAADKKIDEVEDGAKCTAEKDHQPLNEECDLQASGSKADPARPVFPRGEHGTDCLAEQASAVHQGAEGSAKQAATHPGEAADSREAALCITNGRQQDGPESARAAFAGAGSAAFDKAAAGLGASLHRENGKAYQAQAPNAGVSSVRRPESLEKQSTNRQEDQMDPANVRNYLEKVAQELASNVAERASGQAEQPSANVRQSAADTATQPHPSAQLQPATAEAACRRPAGHTQGGSGVLQAQKEAEPVTSQAPWRNTSWQDGEQRQRALASAQGTAAVDDSAQRAPDPPEVYTISSSDDAVIDLRSISQNVSGSTAGQAMAVERIDVASGGCQNTTQFAGAEADSANLLPSFLRDPASAPRGSGHGQGAWQAAHKEQMPPAPPPAALETQNRLWQKHFATFFSKLSGHELENRVDINPQDIPGIGMMSAEVAGRADKRARDSQSSSSGANGCGSGPQEIPGVGLAQGPIRREATS